MSKKKYVVIGLLIFAMLFMVMGGCQSETTEADEASTNDEATTSEESSDTMDAEDAAEDGLVFGIVMINFENPFYISYMEAAQQAADDMGIELIFKSAEGSLETEISLIENFIQQEVDCILADAVDRDGVLDIYKEASDAGIPMISLFNEIKTGYSYSCGYDHYSGFKAVSYAVAEYLDGQGKVCVLQGGIGNWANDERTRGFEEVQAEYPNIELLSMQPSDWDPSKGVQIVENWLTSYDEIDAILCMTDGITPSILEMVETAGRLDEIAIAGNDGETSVLQSMQEGKVMADALLSSLRGGYLSILYADQIVSGAEVEDVVWVPVALVVDTELKAKLESSDADMSFIDILTPDEALAVADNYQNEFADYFN